MKTWLEKLEEKGRKIGREESRREVVKKLLLKGLAIKLVANVVEWEEEKVGEIYKELRLA